jgi:succinate dehydrogenase/fumarate reductase-like Fe-S protein
VLDALLHVQEHILPDLALRWGCRTGRCGTCTVRVDGKVRLACRDRLAPGATVAPLARLPVLRDLVVDRSGPDHLLDGRRPQVALGGGESRASPTPAFLSLEGCITCYACLDGCPAHAAGAGNPAAFLRLQQVREDTEAAPDDRDEAHAVALSLGLADHCASCRGCRCGVGIQLVADVIDPLLAHGP